MQNNVMHPKYFKPELDTPYTLALKYPTPQQVNGFSGPELRWILSDGRAFYTPLDFADKLKAIGITKPGQRFEAIWKLNGRKASWVVQKESVVSLLPDPQPRKGAPQKAATLLDQAGALDAPDAEIEGNSPGVPAGAPTALESALTIAVSAAAQAERHAERLGYACRFSSADVRAMAISVLIQNGRAA